jgi:carbamoyl-phosphate synthase/aspartate carbamoyltransferase/dihydroorotase
MKRLGGDVIDITSQDSSVQKGETFSDCLKTIETYTDLLVIRSEFPHTQISDAKLTVPTINAGDGVGEHPTQALLDLYTIRQERGTINGLTIALVGDLKYGRTVHSLAKLLALYRVNLIYIPSEERFSIPEEIKEYVAKKNPTIQQTTDYSLENNLSQIDVLYMTRMQRERFGRDYDTKMHIITPKILTKAKDNLVIMHPLPRNQEISRDIDNDPRAAYFRQMENGLYIRMALLKMLLDK